MTWLEPWTLLFLSFNWLLSLDEFQWIFLIYWELIKCLIVSVLWWVGWLEWLIMEGIGRDGVLMGDFFLFFNGRNISSKDLLDWVEGVTTFGDLREVLLLDLGLMIFTILLKELTLVIERIWQMG